METTMGLQWSQWLSCILDNTSDTRYLTHLDNIFCFVFVLFQSYSDNVEMCVASAKNAIPNVYLNQTFRCQIGPLIESNICTVWVTYANNFHMTT